MRHPVPRWARRALLPVVAAVLAFPPTARGQVQTEVVVSGLSQPTYVTHAPGDFDRLFVTEQGGDVEIVDLTTDTLIGTFLSVSVTGEGLQGLAFDPSYASNGFFYLYFFDSGVSYVHRYSVSGDPDVADPNSGFPILQVTQPFGNHNC